MVVVPDVYNRYPCMGRDTRARIDACNYNGGVMCGGGGGKKAVRGLGTGGKAI